MRLSTTSPLFVHKVSRVIKIEKNVLDHKALSKKNYIMLAKRGAYYVITNSDIMQISHRRGRAFHHVEEPELTNGIKIKKPLNLSFSCLIRPRLGRYDFH